MSKRRILEFVTYAGIGGTQRMVFELLRHASHKRYAYYLCVLLERNVLNEEVERLGIENCALNMQGCWDLRAWWKLYRFARSKRIDLLRTYGLKAHIIGRLIGTLLRIPVNITSVRSTDPWRQWYHVLLDRLTSGMTDLYLANSEAGRSMTHQRERIPLSKIITIPNGIDLEHFASPDADRHSLSRACRQQFNIPSDAQIIGIVATFRRMKGHQTIVDALPAILNDFPNTRCLFVGDAFVNEPDYKGKLLEAVRRKQLEDVVIFTGERQDIRELLALLDIFVLPSLWEGFSTALLEAMAMKKAVIASAVGGTPEFVESGKTGILIPPNDPAALARAVTALLHNPERIREMGQAAHKYVQQYCSLETVVRQTESIYERLLHNGQT